MMSPSPLLLCTAVLPVQFTACSRDNAARAAQTHRYVDSSGGTVVSLGLPRVPYRPAAVAASGAVSGHITISGALPVDSVMATNRDQRACGDTVALASGASAAGVGNALVWIDGVTTGKPLPEMRRETFTVSHCAFSPRVLAVVSPTTINVYSEDHATHAMRFYRVNEGAVDSVHTVDEGEVVPSERIAAVPGIVEVRCRLHSWEHGWIAAFNHPYFAVTDAT